jgi:hypothetical protein
LAEGAVSVKFYLGTHQPVWLTRLPAVPLMISHRRLARMRRFPRAVTGWALDSGGFTELTLHGQWRTTPATYAAAVRRYQDEIGGLEWAAQQDWMCEGQMLKRTGLTVAEHQKRTVINFLELRQIAADLPIVPVLQGWSVADYLRCADLFEDHGVDLAALPRVGVGSVCRRTESSQIAEIMTALAQRGLQLHGFGVKTRGLTAAGHLLRSADSAAWSRRGRYLPGCSPSHASEANCVRHALDWRLRLLTRITAEGARQGRAA